MKQSVVKNVLLCLGLLVSVTLLKLFLAEHGVIQSPFLLYVLVVVISVWRGGWKWGVFASVVSVLTIDYFFLKPYYSLSTTPGDFTQLVLFLAEAFLISFLGFQLKKANDKSSSLEKKYQILLEKACDVVTLRDKDGKAIYISPRVESVLGYTPKEYGEMSFNDLIHPDDVTYFVDSMKAVCASKDTEKVVCARFRHKDGEYRWVEGSIFDYLTDPDIKAIVSHFKDVTERVLLSSQKDEFIGMASHELRTPLTSVKALIQIAQKKRDVYFLDKAQAHVRRLEKLITDLLDVSKINSGKLSYNVAEHNFREILEEGIESIRHYASTHQIVVKNSPDAIFEGDRYRIEQVITNFISNAIKYSPGVDKVEIDVEVVQRNIVFSVRDFGIGIAPDNLTKLFERFYRVENNAMKFEGLGLGLFIAAEIIKRHHGSFWIESELGKGSTFFFKLPAARNGENENTENKHS
jgi:two-component system CheB/CheR fusion protein